MEIDSVGILHTGLTGLFYVLLLLFTVHAVFLTYHWFKFGTSKSISLLAFAIYLVGGSILFLTFSIGLNLL